MTKSKTTQKRQKMPETRHKINGIYILQTDPKTTHTKTSTDMLFLRNGGIKQYERICEKI